MNSAEVDFHKRKIADIEQDFQAFNEQIFKVYESKKESLLEWARQIEALIEAGELPIDVKEIASYIRQRLRELNVDISDQWITRTLDSKYKRAYPERDATSGISKEPNEVPREYQKPVAVMKNEEVRQALDYFDEQAKELSRRKTEYNEKVQELIEAAHTRGIAIDRVERSVTSTRKEPGASKSVEKWQELEAVVGGLGQKLYDFPPKGDDDERIALAIDKLVLFLRPMQDEKWTKSLVEWFKVQIENIAYGKHAAGSRQASITLMGDKRNMTREQVGDRFDEIMQMACTITGEEIPDESDGEAQEDILKKAIAKAAAHPQVNVLAEWHKKYVEPRIAQRKVDKHDDFSEAA